MNSCPVLCMSGLDDSSNSLPLLSTEPSHATLHTALTQLLRPPPSFLKPVDAALSPIQISYLTRLIASDLSWFKTDDARDEIKELASVVISQQCGRLAAPAMTRTFSIPRSKKTVSRLQSEVSIAEQGTESLADQEVEAVDIEIHEPTITADSLGLKTWTCSFLISRILHTIIPDVLPTFKKQPIRVLELGSGTGLVGISMAKLFSVQCTLTDYLPEIIDNLKHNITINRVTDMAEEELLDWTSPETSSVMTAHDGGKFDIVIATDFLYAQSHSGLVPLNFNLFTSSAGYVLAAYPIRSSNADMIDAFKQNMMAGWKEVSCGDESGYDDWEGQDPVCCHWHLYQRRNEISVNRL